MTEPDDPESDCVMVYRPIVQDWVCYLPLREQGTLLTGIRGGDLTPKLPLDSTARQLTAFLRFLAMEAFDPREIDAEPGAFMQSRPPKGWKPSELGHYPQHFYAHLMHAFEVAGYRHPDAAVKRECYAIYRLMVESLHLRPEPFEEMVVRLAEDRIAKGELVS